MHALFYSIMHNFHIPVLGLSFSIDTPIKVAHYGISSVMSLSSDALVEDMRAHYSKENNLPYQPISEKVEDYRAKRITAYLNMVNLLVNQNLENLKKQSLDKESELTKYLDLLPDDCQMKHWYIGYCQSHDSAIRDVLEHLIRSSIVAGTADVNIMTKVNKANFDSKGQPLPPKYNDALAALRGFAHSELDSSMVFSAGFNPRLYSYLEEFSCFYPNEEGNIKKKIILKVSDYRSAVIQGKFLAKKGIWISEFRIESGLNCGGHAFATEGLLMGPILKEFKDHRDSLRLELFDLCKTVWDKKGIPFGEIAPSLNITVQGGIGTAEEQQFLINHYDVKSTGWGTPFLLVPEATTVDEPTLQKLIAAKSEDLYLSKTSPLGVPFNNLKDSDSEKVLHQRMEKDRPGSPCLKKYLVSNTEFTKEPICTASRQYQHLKIQELEAKNLDEKAHRKAYEDVVVKACLCEDLAAAAYTKYKVEPKVKPATAICPGPNLAFFSQKYSLKEMVGNIYGKESLLSSGSRPHMFINELKMYVDYLEKEWAEVGEMLNAKQEKYLASFKANLETGIGYYQALSKDIKMPTFSCDLTGLAEKLNIIGLGRSVV